MTEKLKPTIKWYSKRAALKKLVARMEHNLINGTLTTHGASITKASIISCNNELSELNERIIKHYNYYKHNTHPTFTFRKWYKIHILKQTTVFC